MLSLEEAKFRGFTLPVEEAKSRGRTELAEAEVGRMKGTGIGLSSKCLHQEKNEIDLDEMIVVKD